MLIKTQNAHKNTNTYQRGTEGSRPLEVYNTQLIQTWDTPSFTVHNL